MLSFAYQVIRKVYKKRRLRALSKYEHLPRDQWRNDYPIVLVHGFGGFVPDEARFFGDYFAYASYEEVQRENRVY